MTQRLRYLLVAALMALMLVGVATAAISVSNVTQTTLQLNGLQCGTAYTVDVAHDVGNARVNEQVSATTALCDDITAPTVAVTNPTDGSTVAGTINVTADAADPQIASEVNSGVAGVQ